MGTAEVLTDLDAQMGKHVNSPPGPVFYTHRFYLFTRQESKLVNQRLRLLCKGKQSGFRRAGHPKVTRTNNSAIGKRKGGLQIKRPDRGRKEDI